MQIAVDHLCAQTGQPGQDVGLKPGQQGVKPVVFGTGQGGNRIRQSAHQPHVPQQPAPAGGRVKKPA